MFSNLLISQGGVVPDNLKLPQNGSTHVYIGIGGQGVDTLKRLKEKISTRLEPETDPQGDGYTHKLLFLAMDTSEYGLRDAKEGSGALAPDEIIFLWPHPVRAMEEEWTSRLAHVPCYQWLSGGLIKSKTGEGSGGVRQMGRVLLVRQAEELRCKLHALLTEARCSVPRQRVHIHIIAGLGGGTGSGCFLDVCYLLRDLLSEEMDALVSGYFFLPDVIGSGAAVRWIPSIKAYMDQNGYAALRELDHFMHLGQGEAFRQDYGSFQVENAMPPVDLCFLLSAVNQDGVQLEQADRSVPEQLANYLFSLTYGSSHAVEDLRNWSNRIHLNWDDSPCYFTLGCAAKELPSRVSATYLSSLLFAEQEERLTRPAQDGLAQEIQRRVRFSAKEFYDLLMEEVPELSTEPLYPPPTVTTLGAEEFDFFHRWEQKGREAILRKKDRLLAPLETYEIQVLRQNPQANLATRLFLALVDDVVLAPQYGPTAAEQLLRNNAAVDLRACLEAVQQEAENQFRCCQANIAPLTQDVAEAAERYNHRPFLLAARHAAYAAYVDACARLWKNRLALFAYQNVQSMAQELMSHLRTLHGDYFAPLAWLARELCDTFRENRTLLEQPARLRDVQNTLVVPAELALSWAKTRVPSVDTQDAELEYGHLMDWLLASYHSWQCRDPEEILVVIRDYLAQWASPYLIPTMEDALNALQRKNLDIQTQVIQPLFQMSAPLLDAGLGVECSTIVTCPENATLLAEGLGALPNLVQYLYAGTGTVSCTRVALFRSLRQ